MSREPWHIVCLLRYAPLTDAKPAAVGGREGRRERKRRAMFALLKTWFGMSLFAAPGNTIFDEMLRSGGRGRRRTVSLVPAYSIYNGIEDPPAPPARPIPTDVPVKEPIDVP